LVFVILLGICGVLVLILFIYQYRDCQEIGGALVRGLFVFECVRR